jgi:hypothetical protein
VFLLNGGTGVDFADSVKLEPLDFDEIGKAG